MTDSRTCEATLALDETMLQTVRQRRSAGESLGSLAREAGLSWQRLWTMLYPPAPAGNQPTVRPAV